MAVAAAWLGGGSRGSRACVTAVARFGSGGSGIAAWPQSAVDAVALSGSRRSNSLVGQPTLHCTSHPPAHRRPPPIQVGMHFQSLKTTELKPKYFEIELQKHKRRE